MDDIFRGMEKMMEGEFRELSKRAPQDLVRERTLPDGSKVKEWGPFVYGYSFTMGPEGKPQVREFGNIKPETRVGRPSLDIREQREPLVDVLETDDEVKVIAELPGVEKRDINLHGSEHRLRISVDAPQHKYYKEIELPTKVNPKTARSSYRNGVLEVTLQRKKAEKPRGERIEIE